MHQQVVALGLCGLLAAAPAWPQSISAQQGLSFGRIAAGGGGTVTVASSGARSASGAVVLISSGSGAPAQFQVTGTGSANYSLTLPSNGTVVLAGPGGASMAVNNFATTTPLTGQLSAGGTLSLNVGATLTVGASQAVGPYTGLFSVIVNYN